MTRRSQLALAALVLAALVGGGIALGTQQFRAKEQSDPASTATTTPSPATTEPTPEATEPTPDATDSGPETDSPTSPSPVPQDDENDDVNHVDSGL